MANLNDERSLQKIANTIFSFDIGMSCSITGFAHDPNEVDGVSPRGKLILDLIKDMYNEKYMRPYYLKQKRNIKIRVHLTNSIGGDVAHPIWKWNKIVANNPKQVQYNIWRIQ